MALSVLDRLFGVQDPSSPTPNLNSVLGQPDQPQAPPANPFAPVSPKDQATSTLNAMLATAASTGDVGRTPDIAYRSSLLPMSVTTTGQIIPDGHSGAVYGAAQALGALPQLGRQLANEAGTTSDPSGMISDTGSTAGANTMGVLNAAATIGAGGYAAPKEAGSLGMFGGRMARTANQQVADLSEQALAKGATDQQVFDAGGWFPGVDRKMRFEIPDAPAVYTGQGSTVGEALSHPDLYAAYPHLANVPFSLQDLGPGALGHTDGAAIVLNSRLAPADARSVLLHELQHNVQEIEDFARGGNADPAGMTGASPEERMSAYRGLAGEVEARNVQARSTMQNLPAPWETQDTPNLNQNPQFTITNGASSSAEPPRLLNDAPLTPEQTKSWIFGSLRPGASGAGFSYPDLPGQLPSNIPADAAAMFGGLRAKTADLDLHDLAVARDTLQGMPGREDITPQSIYADTGWFKGADGKMRFEIPDQASAVIPGAPTSGKLSDLFQHGALYEAYPDLADVKYDITGAGDFGGTTLGSYSAAPGTAMPQEYWGLSGWSGLPKPANPNTETIKLSQNLDPAMLRSVILHEMQHAVQSREGFSAGSNPSLLHSGYDAYQATAGEVEARNVQARADLYDRLGVPPWQTQDVPFADQKLYPREKGEDYREWQKRVQNPPLAAAYK